MTPLRVVLFVNTCIVIRAARHRISDNVELLTGVQEGELADTHPPKSTCTAFDEEVKRLNFSALVNLGADVLCAEWPVDKWGPFPNMNTTKAIEDFVKDSGDYYEKFKAEANNTNKKFCWKHLGYAKKVADSIECPAIFHEKELGVQELKTSADIKPDWAGFCTKPCDQMCTNGTRKIWWCKCPINGTTVTVSNQVWRNVATCPKKDGDHKVMKWGSGCYSTCPAGTNRLNKKMPFCDTNCHSHNEFNTSCGWGCARDKRSCADSTEKMTIYGIAAALDVVSLATAQLEAIPMIYSLVGLVDTLYGLIEKVVFAVQSEHERVKDLPFMAAASKFVLDVVSNAKDAKKTIDEAKDITKKIVTIIKDLYQIAKGADHAKLGPTSILKKLLGKFHLSFLAAIYDTFEAFHKPLCP